MNFVEKINQSIKEMNIVLQKTSSMKEYFINARNVIDNAKGSEYDYYVFGFILNLYNIAITSEYQISIKRFIIGNFTSSFLKFAEMDKQSLPSDLEEKWRSKIASMTLKSATIVGEKDEEKLAQISEMAHNNTFIQFLDNLVNYFEDEINYIEMFSVLYISFHYLILNENKTFRTFCTAFLIETTVNGCFGNGISFHPQMANDFVMYLEVMKNFEIESFSVKELKNWITFLQNKEKKNKACYRTLKKMKKIVK